MEIKPIGTFHSEAVYKQEVPRQGVFFEGRPGRIDLAPGQNFEMALRDLDGFERIWVLFQFHQNEGWRPTTRPPVAMPGKDRVGIFASRSPYRPNSIGLSCVRLLRVEKLTLYVDEADLLDGSPVFDIKPYIPRADSFPNVRAGWADLQNEDVWNVFESERFLKNAETLLSLNGPDLSSFARVQLSNAPFDSTRKRVEIHGDDGVLAFRTFRIAFSIQQENRAILLNQIFSGYTQEELESAEDKYGDKELHRQFNEASK